MKAIIFSLILIQSPLFAQLNCREIKQSDGSSVTKCLHQNGKISTLESWDKDKRFGNLKGFNNQGKELFSYGLRTVGGHASVQLTYFKNGQVKSIYFSDAPDAGIQYYRSTTQFDEVGNQTSFTEDSHEDKLRLEIREIPLRDTTKPGKPLVEINQALAKPIPKRLDFLIINKTRSGKRITLDYTAFGSDTILKIPAKQELYQTILTDVNEQNGKQIPQLNLSGNTKRFEIIRGKEENFADHRVITWYIIKI